MNTEKTIIQQCIRQIEHTLGWGSSLHWTNDDFENLSEAIRQKTGVSLSVTTLKRIWGRARYDSTPNSTTLNTLARFTGHASWRGYRRHAGHPEIPSVAPSEESGASIATRRSGWPWVAGVLLLVTVVIAAFLVLPFAKEPEASDYAFTSSKTVLEGVPNSVVFHYDAAASPTDSVFIQQSWDKRRSTLVSKDRHSHTAIYYYPGYFRAKLVIGDRVVREHDLFITSDDWVAAVDRTPVPAYLKPEDFKANGIIDVTAGAITALGIPLQPVLPPLRVYNVKQMAGLKTDQFTFTTRVKSHYRDGTGVCQKIDVLILCKNDVFIIPLVSKRCVGDIFLLAADKVTGSTEADLSGFGAELSEWTSLKVESSKKNVRFFVNDKEAYALTFENSPSEIVGVQYRFQGPGAIGETVFSNSGQEFVF